MKYVFTVLLIQSASSDFMCLTVRSRRKGVALKYCPTIFWIRQMIPDPGHSGAGSMETLARTAITRDLEEMKDKGMSRAEIWDVAAARNPDNFIPAGGRFPG